ncbi:hypothetical protein [Streptomyces sp. HUAS TT20]|uniref:hypothetical protein n=1 Tax=Streptomyces sp. HUAS TT20 TaxID=3447509 RepID=UPI0021D9B232|nr:hypothetical protein [Streptomyces sp. HUAS 15-9]UXY30458.1 hypothetical protein N8I87_30535 [Streptomyces sp. HUAS 15-9]
MNLPNAVEQLLFRVGFFLPQMFELLLLGGSRAGISSAVGRLGAGLPSRIAPGPPRPA